MAETYRPTIIRFYDSQGRQVRKGTPGAKRVREKSKTYWGRCADANGKVRPVGLCDDEQAAEAMLAEMKLRAKRIARGTSTRLKITGRDRSPSTLKTSARFWNRKGTPPRTLF